MQFGYRNIWKMSYPILISMLMQQLVGITDVIYLGRLGEVDLGASALGSTYFFTIFMVAFGFSIGAQIMMARRNGEKKFQRIGEIFYQGCSFMVFASLTFIFLSTWMTPLLLKSLIDNPAIYEATINYIDWRVWGLISASLLVMARAFFVSITITYVLTLVSLMMVLTNVVLNYILIFGKFGLPPMGISGAALASNLSEIIAVLTYVCYFIIKIDLRKYGLTKFVYKNFSLLKKILNLSVWTMLQQFISVATWFLFFVAIEHLGERELAVSNVIRSLSSFPYVVINAMAATISSVTSNLIGQSRQAEVIPSCFKVFKLCSAIIIPLLIVMALLVYPLLRIYTNNQSLISDSIPSYMVMLSAFIPLVPGWILFSAVSGTGNTRYAVGIEFAAMTFYVLHIVTIILYFKMPLPICWTADWIYNIVILIVSYRYMLSYKWCNKEV